MIRIYLFIYYNFLAKYMNDIWCDVFMFARYE